MAELIFSAVMLTACAVLFVTAGNYPSQPISRGGGASFYPRFMTALLFLLMLIYIFQNRQKMKAALKKGKQIDKKKWLEQYKYWLLFLLVLILVPASLPYLGFVVTGIWSIFAASMIIRGKEGKLSLKGAVLSAAMAIVVSVVIYMVFVKVFIIPLPMGKLF